MPSLAFRKASICSRSSFSASCTLVVNPQHATRSRLILCWKLPPPSGSSCIGKDSQLTWGAPTHIIPVSRTQFWARGTGVPRGRIGRGRTYGQEEAGSFQEAPGGTPAGIAAGHDAHRSGWARGRCGAGTGHRRSGCQLVQQGISVSSEQQRTTAPADGRWRPRPDPRGHLRRVHLLRRGDQPKAAGSRAVDAALHCVPGEAGERVAGTYRRVVPWGYFPQENEPPWWAALRSKPVAG